MAKSFTLPKTPTGGTFRNWISEAYSLMDAASNRRKKRTRLYVQAVERCPDPEKLLDVPSRWESVDNELLSAVTAVATPELQREIVNKKEALQRQGRFLSGRYGLWMFYDLFKIDFADSIQIDLTTLWKFECNGDLALCLAGPDALLLNFNHNPSSDMIEV